MGFEHSVGPGWKKITEPVVALCEKEGASIAQIKEKFGGLRFYLNSGNANPAVREAIKQAEIECSKTCEDCGAPGRLTTDGWWRTLCNNCEGKRA